MRIAIVTGASSGLGREYAKLPGKEGMDEIWLIARRENLLYGSSTGKYFLSWKEINLIARNPSVKEFSESLHIEDKGVKFTMKKIHANYYSKNFMIILLL